MPRRRKQDGGGLLDDGLKFLKDTKLISNGSKLLPGTVGKTVSTIANLFGFGQRKRRVRKPKQAGGARKTVRKPRQTGGTRKPRVRKPRKQHGTSGTMHANHASIFVPQTAQGGNGLLGSILGALA